jgi:hypothetical protein
MQRRKRKGQPGDIVRVDVGDDQYTYGVLLTDPFVAVYDILTKAGSEVEPIELLGRSVLFIAAVYDDAIGRDWPIVGSVPAGSRLPAVPEQFTQDRYNPQSCQIIDADGNTRPATPQECVGLERAAVWEPEHVVGRIQDHYAGRPNFIVERFKVKL